MRQQRADELKTVATAMGLMTKLEYSAEWCHAVAQCQVLIDYHEKGLYREKGAEAP